MAAEGATTRKRSGKRDCCSCLTLESDNLALFQCNNYGFSVPVVFRGKAQCESKGTSLVEYCNAAAGHYREALRVSLSTSTDCVAPLAKGPAITGEACLAMNVGKLTESAIITLKERWLSTEGERFVVVFKPGWI